ncbi:MAG: glycoside hydrolase family 3 N-terminal domain-containing protein [Pseudomonadota bacterium]
MTRRLVRMVALILALVLAWHLGDPAFARMRGVLAFVLMVAGLFMAGLFMAWSRRPDRTWLVVGEGIGWLAAAALAGWTLYTPWAARHALFHAAEHEPARMAALGEHLVIGYDDMNEVRELARRGLIGGLFVTRRNIEGKTAGQLRMALADLQEVRRRVGLPPLMIATDQEGGPVSRLSPLAPRQPPLSSLAGHPDAQRLAADYGDEQGRALARLGINVNFSPVVDLKPGRPPDPSDRHTRIAERAIAADPDTVSRIALAYSRALAMQGVTPVLKHFPGLGDARGDTHLHGVHLATSLERLAARDWRPFREVMEGASAMLMVGHVTLDALDPNVPASLSRPVLTGLLRESWHYEGVLISDDMSMAAVHRLGLCRASIQALKAGQDMLLIAWDWRAYYPVMECLRRASDAGTLPDLGMSRRRLAGQPWRHASSAARRGADGS